MMLGAGIGRTALIETEGAHEKKRWDALRADRDKFGEGQ